MDYLLEKYYEACSAMFLQHGFKKNRAFVRVINDVMQNVSIEKLYSGREWRVEFAVVPLCLRIEKRYILGGVYSHNLKRFEPTKWEGWDAWDCDPGLEDSMDTCVKEIVRYFATYLFPFFERANSCETALPELIKLEKLFNDNRLEGLRRDGIQDGAGPGAELHLSDSAKYYMALKIRDYDFALRSRKELLEVNTNNHNSKYESLTEEEWAQGEKHLAKLREEVSRIERRDEAEIRKIIEDNEAYSRNNLKSFIKKD